MFYTDDGFDDVYGHPELLPHKLPGLREIRCGQCGHEMQILEQFEEPSVPCAQCGQAVVLHGFGLEIPEDNSELEAELPATVFRVEGRQQQRKASRLRDLRYWGLAMVMIVIYIAFEIVERIIRKTLILASPYVTVLCGVQGLPGYRLFLLTVDPEDGFDFSPTVFTAITR